MSATLYALSIPIALVFPYVSVVIFVFVAMLWFVPDRRFEVAQSADRLAE